MESEESLLISENKVMIINTKSVHIIPVSNPHKQITGIISSSNQWFVCSKHRNTLYLLPKKIITKTEDN